MIRDTKRPEKFQMSLEQLELYDIHPYRFSAVNGWELSLETINAVGFKYSRKYPKSPPKNLGDPRSTCNHANPKGFPAPKLDLNRISSHEVMQEGRTYFRHNMTPRTIGIALSHFSILQDAYDSGYQTVWIMEDDIRVIQNPHKISIMIEKLDQTVGKYNWDVLFTDLDQKDSEGNNIPASGVCWRPNSKSLNSSITNHFIDKTFNLNSGFILLVISAFLFLSCSY